MAFWLENRSGKVIALGRVILRSVLARVRKLGGDVELVSSATGATLAMTLPLSVIR